MKKTPYINYLTSELDSHLYRMMNNDRTAQHEAIQNMINNPQAKEHDFSHTKSLFDFYFDTLEFSPTDIFQAIGTRDQYSILKLLYEGVNAQVHIRTELKEKFQPIIEKDINVYKECLKLCLSTHLETEQALSKNIEQYYEYPHIQSLFQKAIDNNRNLFIDLVNIGIKQEFFSKIDKEILRTKNDFYQSILQSHNLLDKESFSIDEYAKLILYSYSSNNNRHGRFQRNNDDKLSSYQLHHIQSIFPLVKNFDDYQKLAQEKFKELDKDNTPYLVITPINYVRLFCSEQNHSSKSMQNEFLENWLNEPSIRFDLIKDKYSLEGIFSSYESKILSFLKKITKEEYESILEDSNWGYCNFDKSNLYGNFIHNMVSLVTKLDTPIEDMPKILEHLINLKQNSTQEMFFGAMLSHLGKNFSQRIEATLKSNENNQEHLINVLKVCLKHQDILFAGINIQNNGIHNAIYEAETLITTINKYSTELGITTKETDEVKNKCGQRIQEFFKSTIDNSYNYSFERNIPSLREMLEDLNGFEFINQQDLWNHKFSKQKTNSKNKVIGYYEEYPLVFELLAQTKKPEKYLALFKEDTVSLIESTTFNKKSIFEYLASTDKKKFSTLIQSLTEKEDIFNKLILENKKILKLIEKTEDYELIKTVEVMNFNYKLKNKLQKSDSEEPTQKRFKL